MTISPESRATAHWLHQEMHLDDEGLRDFLAERVSLHVAQIQTAKRGGGGRHLKNVYEERQRTMRFPNGASFRFRRGVRRSERRLF